MKHAERAEFTSRLQAENHFYTFQIEPGERLDLCDDSWTVVKTKVG